MRIKFELINSTEGTQAAETEKYALLEGERLDICEWKKSSKKFQNFPLTFRAFEADYGNLKNKRKKNGSSRRIIYIGYTLKSEQIRN